VCQALFNSALTSNFSRIPGYGELFREPTGSAGYSWINLPDGPTKTAVLWAYSDSFKPVWLMGCVMLCTSLVVSSSPKGALTTDYALDEIVLDESHGPSRGFGHVRVYRRLH